MKKMSSLSRSIVFWVFLIFLSGLITSYLVWFGFAAELKAVNWFVLVPLILVIAALALVISGLLRRFPRSQDKSGWSSS